MLQRASAPPESGGRTAPGSGGTRVDLAVGGMTCAACAARIEKKLNALDGVTATVNYANRTAAVDYNPELIGPDRLISTVAGIGYSAALPAENTAELMDAEERRAQRDLFARLMLALPLTVAVVLIGMRSGFSVQHLSHGMHGTRGHAETLRWISLELTTPVVLICGFPFHRAALMNLRHRTTTMDTLVSMGTLAAFIWSVWAVITGRREVYFEVSAAVTTFLLFGRWAEARSKRRAGAAIRELFALGAKEVTLLDPDGTERLVDANLLRVDDLFVVRPGEKVATDGVIERGASALDMSMITGESVPVERGPGDEVVGASINANGRLVVRATKIGSETALAQIARLVAEAQSGKANVQRLADRVAGIFVPVVLGLALITLTAWLAITGNVDDAFTATVAVLIIACPCALGLATPTALMVGTGRGAQLGLLIRGPEVLERTQRLDVIVLDKTGTVTTGKMSVHTVTVPAGADLAGALRLVGAAEHPSEHPIARAIGCSEGCSAAPTRRSAPARSAPAGTVTVCTLILPVVTVPVLSSTMTSSRLVRSGTSGPRISRPSCAPRPVPTINAVGVASPRAHGQAMISTATVAVKAPSTLPVMASHAVSVISARPSTTGTKMPATRSASRCTLALPDCASATSRAIWANAVSDPILVARTTSRPLALTEAPITSSPGPRSTGTLSPVIIDRSNAEAPRSMTPSVATFSPGRTTNRSPTRNWAASTRRSMPSGSSRVTSFAPRANSSRMAAPARRFDRASAQRPNKRNVVTAAETSKYTSRRPVITAQTDQMKAASVPIETRVSMVVARWRRFISAARWNGNPQMRTTGVVSSREIQRRVSACPRVPCMPWLRCCT